MEKRILNLELEKQLYNYGYTKALDYIKKNCGINTRCILLTKYDIGDFFNDLKINELYKIIYVESGSCVFKIEDKIYELEPGDVLLLPPHTSYKFVKIVDTKTKVVVLISSKSYIKSFNTPTSDLLIIFDKVQSVDNYQIKVRPTFKSRITSTVTMLQELFLSKEYGDDILFNATFASLVTRMNKGVNFFDVDKYFVTYSLIIKQINNYINENIENKILIGDIANYVGLSESRISHIYKSHMGISISQYIIKKRLSIAKDMLKIGTSLSEVSIKCGFQDYSSFLRSFKKEFEISPKAYQNNYYKD